MRQYKKRQLRLLSRVAVLGQYIHDQKATHIAAVQRKQLVRLEVGLIALILLSGTLLQTYFQLNPTSYNLTPAAKSLVGESRDDTSQYLKQNKDQTAFEFAVPGAASSEGASVHTGRNADAYSANLSVYAREGITVTDSASKIAVTLIPKFYTGKAQKVEGDHVVYAMGANKLVYTLKYNGLKEDIIVPSYQGNDLDYQFTLRLPSGVEAKLDTDGSIGIYSADPTLFGNISYGSDQDREKVEKARTNSPKTNRVMTIPAPIVKDATGTEYTDKSQFTLSSKTTGQTTDTRTDLPAGIPKSLITTNDYTLTIASTNLQDLSYPIAIDPTLQVKDAADFTNVNLEGGAELDTTNSLVRRSRLTGGALNSFTNTNPDIGTTTIRPGVATYNGFIYLVGGTQTTNQVQWAQITNEANGTIGTWQSSNLLGDHERSPGAVAYNGYLYVIAGTPGATTRGVTTVEYTKIGSNGAPTNPPGCGTTWCLTTNYPFGNVGNTVSVGGLSAVARNGYIYVAGGCVMYNFQTCFNDDPGPWNATNSMYRAPINPDGTLGAWTQSGLPNSGNLPTTLYSYGAGVWGDYYYIVGGRSRGGGSPAVTTTVYYARINPDGTMSGSSGGAWLTTISLPVARADFALSISNGYMYVTGGYISSVAQSDTIYTQINADGTLDGWRSTGVALASAVADVVSVPLSSGIVVLGGNNGGCAPNNCQKVQYASFKTAGELHAGTWTQSPNEFQGGARGRTLSSAVAYNGFLYSLNGCSGLACHPDGLVDYAPINADGSIGTWITSTNMVEENVAFLTNRPVHSGVLVAHDGYLYVIGGCNQGSGQANDRCGIATNKSRYAPINSNGSLGGWVLDDQDLLSETVAFGGGVVYGGRVYIAGGCTADCNTANPANTHNETRSAPLLGASGGVGAWTNHAGVLLPKALRAGRMAIWGNTMYFSGGETPTAPSADVYKSTINAAGVPGAWSDDTDLPGNRIIHGFAAYNGYMYLYGGVTAIGAGNEVSSVYYAKINNNGTLGSWIPTQSMLNIAAGFGAVAHAGVLYAVAASRTGVDGNVSDYTVYHHVHNGGSGRANSFTLSTTTGNGSMPTTQYDGAAVAIDGSIYWIAGIDGGGASANVYKATTAGDGAITGWSTSGQAQWPGSILKRQRFGIAVYNNRIYITGGCDDSCATNRRDTVVGTLSGGNITAWNSGGVDMAAPGRADMAMEAYAGYLYTFGGQTTGPATVTVERVQIDSTTGLLTGSWTPDTSMGTARTLVGSAIHNGVVYILGGQGSSTTLATTEYATIDSQTHQVGAWKVGNSMNSVRWWFKKAVILNGYIYVATGRNSGNTSLTVEYAPIAATGELGLWQRSSSINTGRVGAGVVINNGTLYVVGGYTGIGQLDTSERAGLQSISRIGSFSKLHDFSNGIKPTKLITRGTKRPGATVAVSYQPNRVGMAFGGTFTATNATERLNVTAHRLSNGDMVRLSTSASDLPNGLTAGTTYYVINATTNDFQVSLTSGGSVVTFSDNGTGTHRYDYLPATNTILDTAYNAAGMQTLTTGSVTLSRYFWLRYTIDDSKSAVFPDDDNQSTITDFDVYFISNPNARLRGGRTFAPNGAGQAGDRGLDAGPQ